MNISLRINKYIDSTRGFFKQIDNLIKITQVVSKEDTFLLEKMRSILTTKMSELVDLQYIHDSMVDPDDEIYNKIDSKLDDIQICLNEIQTYLTTGG